MILRTAPRRWRHGRLAAIVSLAYLVVVIAAYVFAVVSSSIETEDANLGGVWPYLVTMPLSLLAILLVPDKSGSASATSLLLALPVVCGGLQAAGLWLLLRGRPTSTGPRRP